MLRETERRGKRVRERKRERERNRIREKGKLIRDGGKRDLTRNGVCVILQEKLSKTVNMRAMNMLGKAEERVREWGREN